MPKTIAMFAQDFMFSLSLWELTVSYIALQLEIRSTSLSTGLNFPTCKVVLIPGLIKTSRNKPFWSSFCSFWVLNLSFLKLQCSLRTLHCGPLITVDLQKYFTEILHTSWYLYVLWLVSGWSNVPLSLIVSNVTLTVSVWNGKERYLASLYIKDTGPRALSAYFR